MYIYTYVSEEKRFKCQRYQLAVTYFSFFIYIYISIKLLWHVILLPYYFIFQDTLRLIVKLINLINDLTNKYSRICDFYI